MNQYAIGIFVFIIGVVITGVFGNVFNTGDGGSFEAISTYISGAVGAILYLSAIVAGSTVVIINKLQSISSNLEQKSDSL